MSGRAIVDFREISVEEFVALRRDSIVCLVYVRTDAEVMRGKVSGSVHIPLAELPARLGELTGRNEIVVYCHSGMRSGQACAYLAAQGLTNVYNLAGGILAWMRAGLEVTQE